ncbi:hypothetical protein ACFYYR_10250 [Streptomyces sp. NPDC001922]|uniref:hypothetical protein n=1 Tax=Streptomyces sp. NPDC001922 TaxID=3364624 RepID=UPI00367FDBA3
MSTAPDSADREAVDQESTGRGSAGESEGDHEPTVVVPPGSGAGSRASSCEASSEASSGASSGGGAVAAEAATTRIEAGEAVAPAAGQADGPADGLPGEADPHSPTVAGMQHPAPTLIGPRAQPQPPAQAGVPAPPTLIAPQSPRPPAARNRLVTWGALVLAAFVVGGAATAGALVLRGGDRGSTVHGAGDDKPPAVRSAAPATPGPGPGASTVGAVPSVSAGGSSPAPSPSSTAPAAVPATPGPASEAGLPENYRLARDPQGFSLGVPRFWQREVSGGQIDYRGTTGNSYLRMGIRSTAQSSYGHFLELQDVVRKKSADYRNVELTENTFQGRPGARWEFTWTEKGTGRTMHAIDQSYVTEDGTEYAIYFQERDDMWPVAREVFDVALSTWSVG